MTLFGKAIHLGIDAIIISTALAGIRRNTGLAPKTDIFGKDIQPYFQKVLESGDYVYDTTVGIMNNSGYFVRK
ncbi:hypothetical protein BON22_0449 [Cyberlindnera fabianii]|uniref:DUF1748-domain-containing protein n=1 Tax=Cyberlindnera fabianii TaxID=36022 RepID=A0A1V2LDL6_CYBFA|nr:hypothetical protein BON22_0449 [Cyberlindnera fabianii]